MTSLEDLKYIIETEEADARLTQNTLRAYCRGVDIEKLQDLQALGEIVLGHEIVRAYRKLKRTVLR